MNEPYDGQAKSFDIYTERLETALRENAILRDLLQATGYTTADINKMVKALDEGRGDR